MYSKTITLNSYTVHSANIISSVQEPVIQLDADVVYTFGKNKQPVYMALAGNTSVYGISASRTLSTWSPIYDTSTSQLSRVIWDGSKWIITYLDSHQISYTYDQVTYLHNAVPNEYASIGFNPVSNMYIAVGNSGVYTSYDAIHWTSNASGTALMNNTTNYHNGKVVYNGAMWVIAGNGGDNPLIYSYDGVTWNSSGPGIFDPLYGAFDVAWSGSVWVAVGAPILSRHAVAYSYNGTTWTTVALSNAIIKSNSPNNYLTNKPMTIEWDGNAFVVTLNATLSSGNHNYIVSYDGINWDHTQGNIIQSANIAKWTGSNFVIAGQDPSNSILLKQNGGYADWHLGHNLHSDTIYDLEANAEFNNTVLFPRSIIVSGKSHSYDGGFTWTDTSMNMLTTVKKIQTNGKQWIAVGDGPSDNIATSNNGINWIGGGKDVMTTINDIWWNGSLWIAVGSSIARSHDGIYWITTP
jgi:hypothetical protein